MKKVFFTLILIMSSTSASAGLIYELSTELKFVRGLNADGLDGATMTFRAGLADGAVYQESGLSRTPTVFSQWSEWTITGSNIDGTYRSPCCIGWYGSYNGGKNAGWFEDGSFHTDIAGLRFVAIFHNAVPGITAGALVKASDWGPTITRGDNFFSGTDGTKYDWKENATFSVRESSNVPLPATGGLMLLALALMLNAVRKRPDQHVSR